MTSDGWTLSPCTFQLLLNYCICLSANKYTGTTDLSRYVKRSVLCICIFLMRTIRLTQNAKRWMVQRESWILSASHCRSSKHRISSFYVAISFSPPRSLPFCTFVLSRPSFFPEGGFNIDPGGRFFFFFVLSSTRPSLFAPLPFSLFPRVPPFSSLFPVFIKLPAEIEAASGLE